MSNYTKTTDFAAKDTLPSGDSGKIIRGSEFGTEFDNIATAIASKSDSANPNFTGSATINGDLTVTGDVKLGDTDEIQLGNAADLKISHSGGGSTVENDTGNLTIKNRAVDGDIYFQSDDGTGVGTDTYFFLDGGEKKTKFLENVLISGDLETTGAVTTADLTATGVVDFSGASSVIGGVPAGGTTGQILAKNSNTNYDVGFVDPADVATLAATNVTVADAGGYYTSNNVEGALQEIGAQPPGFDPNTDSFNIGSDAVSSGTDSIALGHDASATGISGISLGPNTTASGGRSISIGDSASATGGGSIALGQNASVTGGSSTALGFGATVTATTAAIAINDATASGVGSMAIHDNSLSSGSYSMAIGYWSQATAASAMAVGYSSEATAVSSTALGNSASATGDKSIAIGFDSSASFVDAIAIGNDTRSDALGSIAIGTGSDASRLGSVALGKGAQATASGATIAIGEGATTFNGLASPIAIGYQANTTGAYGVGLGYQTVTSGAQSIAIGYIASATNDNSIAIGRQLTVAGQKAVGIGWGVVAGSYDSIGIGTSANASTTNCISIGASSSSLATGGIAIGNGASIGATNQYGVAVGYGAQSLKIGGVAVGNNANCDSQFGTALGRDSNASTGGYATALGYGSVAGNYATAINNSDATGQRSVAIGNSAVASADDSIAIGYNADALGADSIAIGNIAGADAANTIHINASGVDTNQPQTAGYIVIETDDASLNYDGSWSLTGGPLNLSGGIDVTGTATTDGLTVQTSQGNVSIPTNTSSLNFDRAGSNYIRATDAAGSFTFITGANDFATQRMKLVSNGDMALYEDTGTTPKFFWDASAERLGLGTSSPKTQLDIATGTGSAAGPELTLTNGFAALTTGDRVGAINFYTSDGSNRGPNNSAVIEAQAATSLGHDANLVFKTGVPASEGQDAVETMRIDYQGNVGIGGSTPSEKLEVSNGSVTDSGEISIKLGGDVDNNARTMTITKDTSTPYNTIINTQNNTGVTTGSLIFKNGATEQMRIDSSGNVGIGTSSPQEELHIEANYPQLRLASDLNVSSSSNLTCTVDGYATDGRAWRIGRAFGSSDMKITNDHSSAMIFATNSTERMRIDAAGNVGVGLTSNTSVNSKFQTLGNGITVSDSVTALASKNCRYFGVSQADQEATMMYLSATSANNTLIIGGGTSLAEPASVVKFHTGAVGTKSAGAEAMRINSSGDLVVGKTTVNSLNTVGAEVQADGQVKLASDGKYPLQLNRLTSDGEIISLRKDGTTVGSIGAYASARMFIGSGDSNVTFNSSGNNIYPATSSGAANDATLTLGSSTARFNNLYLSGGAYLGGVAAANKLDDYEEGTWTPVASNAQGFTLGTPTGANGSYTKVGRSVSLKCGFTSLDSTDVIAAGDRFEVTGIPFSTSGNYTAATASAGSCFIYNSFGGGALATGTVTHSGSVLIVMINSVLGSPTFSNDLNIGITYESA